MTSKAVLTGVFTLFVMNTRTLGKCFGILALLGLLAACGGNGSGSGTGPDAATAVIGPAGGTLTGPDGVQVVIPDGALDQPTEISIARRSAGAPAVLDAYPAAGSIYEFTPHDLYFNRPIIIRAPVFSGASDTSVFMASPGEDWKLENVTVIGGVAEWARNSFSWMYPPVQACAVPPSRENDPYWCQHAGASGQLIFSATPPTALIRTSPDVYSAVGSFRVDQAAMLHIGSNFTVVKNCSNVRVELLRRRFNPTTRLWEPPLTQSGQSLSLQSPTLTQSPLQSQYFVGRVNFNLPFTSLDQGKNYFAWWLSYDCPTPLTEGGYGSNGSHDKKIGEVMVLGNIPAPSVFYTVGGTVSGLTGSGLVLQNNGGDNLPITANGAFTFARSVGENLPYRVTVLTQPAGQTCSVANGSGTITANVNVTVNCAARTIRITPAPADPTPAGCSPLPRADHTVTFTVTGGTAPYSWSSSEGEPTNLTVISTTQVQWYDSASVITRRFCGQNGNVTITATDSTGSSGSVTFPVLGIY